MENEVWIGVTDKPCDNEQMDRLDIKKYVDGLETFIRKCYTPMSIAIQGDWGTGKTSMINMLQKRFDKAGNIKCVYFNTWQYSQFNMADDLYLSFVNTLVHKCFPGAKDAQKILKIAWQIGEKMFFNRVKQSIDVDIEEIFQLQKEKIECIEKLKDNFQELVEDTVNIKNKIGNKDDGRIVIFIDDLDRLNPQIAVELLEVIKLFMDVEKCVFVLAIDYDVVVSGLRGKYGQNVSDEKCRSFFDKIIQLPFRLPVESYRLDQLIRETVTKDDILEPDIEPLAVFVSGLLGTNPRAYKRLANSYFLIKSVNETLHKNNDNQLDNVLIFGGLCIQMCTPELYQIMINASDTNKLREVCEITEESLDAYLECRRLDFELDEKEKKNIFNSLEFFHDFLEQIKENHDNEKDILKQLCEILQMTAITEVTTENNKSHRRAVAVKVNKVIINNEEQSVNTPTEAFIKVYEKLLGENKELYLEYCKEEQKILTEDEEKKDAYFRNKKEIFKTDHDRKVYIGVSSSTSDKIRYVEKLCAFMRKNGYDVHVIWKYDDEIKFDSEEAKID